MGRRGALPRPRRQPGSIASTNHVPGGHLRQRRHARSVRCDLVFITRDGCVNTPDMLLNLDDALRGLGLALDYEVVNLGKLPKSDSRTGYPTPTVLYRNRDLFDTAAPVPPYPEPS